MFHQILLICPFVAILAGLVQSDDELFKCSDGAAIASSRVCDFRTDCTDGSDEMNCGYKLDFEDGSLHPWTDSPSSSKRWTFDSSKMADESQTAIKIQHSNSNQVTMISSPYFKKPRYECSVSFEYMFEAGQALFLGMAAHDTFFIEIWNSIETPKPFNEWHNVTVNIGKVEDHFKLRFRARMYGYQDNALVAYVANIRLSDDCHYRQFDNSSDCGDKLKCRNGQCIDKKLICNTIPDCEDGSDENDSCPPRFCHFNPDKKFCFFDQIREDIKSNGWSIDKSCHALALCPTRDHTTNDHLGFFAILRSFDKVIRKGTLMSKNVYSDCVTIMITHKGKGKLKVNDEVVELDGNALGNWSPHTFRYLKNYSTLTISGETDGYIAIDDFSWGWYSTDNDHVALTMPTWTQQSPYCFSFWIFHKEVISVRLVAKAQGQDDIAVEDLLWGSQFCAGDWCQKQLQINPADNKGTLLSLVMSRTSGTTGVAAFDSLSLIPGECRKTASCDFNINFCGYQVTGSWLIGTGRLTDPTLAPGFSRPKTDSNYAYTDFTAAKKCTGQVAQLASDTVHKTGEFCLKISYYNYDDITTFKIIKADSDQAESIILAYGSSVLEKKSWTTDFISIESKKHFSLQFLVKSNGCRTFFAIDTVELNEGNCKQNGAKPHQIVVILPHELSCDFEDGGLCLWSSSSSDSGPVQWQVSDAAKMANNPRLPKDDHTLKSSKGRYAFLDNIKQETTLSRVVGKLDKDVYCFRAWTIKVGDDSTKLRILVKTNGADIPILVPSSLKWRQVQLSFQAFGGKEITFSIVGEVGREGFVAVDDVEVSKGACQDDQVVYSCGFYDTDDCQLTHGNTELTDLTWSLEKKVVTHSTDTVFPGRAMVLRGKNGRAFFRSKLIHVTEVTCLSFWYKLNYNKFLHNDATSSNTLKVYLDTATEYDNDEDPVVLINESESSGDIWLPVHFQVYPGKYFIRVEGTRSSGSIEDFVAIDDIVMVKGLCPSNTCDFDSDDCSWRNIGGLMVEDLEIAATTNWFQSWSQIAVNRQPNTGSGSQDGAYMMIDKSRHDALLLSPRFKFSEQGHACFSYSFYMSSHYQRLRLAQVEDFKGYSISLAYHESHDGNTGKWENNSVLIRKTELVGDTDFYWLAFNGYVTQEGDVMAISDFSFDDDKCPTPTTVPPTTTTMSIDENEQLVASLFSCSFDERDYCRLLAESQNFQHTFYNQTSENGILDVPVVDKASSGSYIMLTANTGSTDGLEYALELSDTTTHSNATETWTIKPDIGRWYKARKQLSSRDAQAKTQIKLKTTPKFSSSIALDSLSYHAGDCSAPADCDFEVGFCDYVPDSGYWLIGHGRLLSKDRLGPNFFAPLSDTRYAYVDFSQADKGAKTSLKSDWVEGGDSCLEFKYFTYQFSHTDNIVAIYLVHNATSKHTISFRPVAATIGWTVGMISLMEKDTYYVSLEVTSSDAKSFFAIDYVKVTKGKCVTDKGHGTEGTIVDHSLTCDFENGDLCDWKDVGSSPRWEVMEADKSTSKVFPRSDHTLLSHRGKYAFSTTAFHPRRMSATFGTNMAEGDYCFSLWSVMGGRYQRKYSLSIEVEQGSSTQVHNVIESLKWKQTWIPLTLQPYSQIHITLSAYLPDPGDEAAVDDIELRHGHCKRDMDVLFRCDFTEQEGFCGLTNEPLSTNVWNAKQMLSPSSSSLQDREARLQINGGTIKLIGTSSGSWTRYHLENLKEHGELKIEAKVTPSIVGNTYIALDDFSWGKHCPVKYVSPELLSCDFSNGTTCDWILDGNFVFIDSSSNIKADGPLTASDIRPPSSQNAIQLQVSQKGTGTLRSGSIKLIKLDKTLCFQLDYYLFGNDGQIKVYLLKDQLVEQVVWYLDEKSDSVDKWHRAKVNLKKQDGDFELFIEASIDSSTHVAFDNFVLTEGECQKDAMFCNFDDDFDEKPNCNWLNIPESWRAVTAQRVSTMPYDHSSNSIYGRFLYLEGKAYNQAVITLSDKYEHSGPHCLTFWEFIKPSNAAGECPPALDCMFDANLCSFSIRQISGTAPRWTIGNGRLADPDKLDGYEPPAAPTGKGMYAYVDLTSVKRIVKLALLWMLILRYLK
ncbi:MAM and LDL-receptor class A domain-containing protein 1 [Halotydeus destructor]|nr:MAM and LDL-receptor class A domain-containing protein 1 [Halotydeus destructor]